MHSEGKRCLRWCLSFNVLNVLLIRQWSWALECDVLSFNEGEEFSLVEKLILHENFEEGRAETSVKVINDVTTVHDLTEDVTEIIPRNLSTCCILFHVVVQYS